MFQMSSDGTFFFAYGQGGWAHPRTTRMHKKASVVKVLEMLTSRIARQETREENKQLTHEAGGWAECAVPFLSTTEKQHQFTDRGEEEGMSGSGSMTINI